MWTRTKCKMSSSLSELATAAATSTILVWMKVADSETKGLVVRAAPSLLVVISEAAVAAVLRGVLVLE